MACHQQGYHLLIARQQQAREHITRALRLPPMLGDDGMDDLIQGMVRCPQAAITARWNLQRWKGCVEGGDEHLVHRRDGMPNSLPFGTQVDRKQGLTDNASAC